MSLTLLWSLALKGSIDILIAAILVLVLRKSSAPRRHLVWLAGVVGLVLLPATFIVLPKWQIATQPSSLVTKVMAPEVVTQTQIQIKTPTPPLKAQAASLSTFAPTRPSPTQNKPFDWIALIPTLWWIGFAVCMLSTLLGLIQGGLIAHRARAFRTEEVKGRGKVEIRISKEINVPSMIGWWNPVILIPSSASDWTPDRLRMAIAHEIGHIRRNDWAWQQMASLACAIHFFNPLAWWAAKSLREESEFACDDSVIDHGFDPTDYAQELVNIAKSAHRTPVALLGMASTSKVSKRLLSILDEKRSRRSLSRGGASLLILGSTLLLLPLGMLIVVANPVAKIRTAYEVKLPQIPQVSSEQVGENVFLAKNGIAALPGGTRVRLIGISDNQTDDFWGLDSKEIPNVENWSKGGRYWQGPGFHRWGYVPDPKAALNRTFLVEIESEEGGNYASDQKIDPSSLTALERVSPQDPDKSVRIANMELAPNAPAAGWLEVGFSKAQDKAVYRFGLAGPDWKTVAKIDNPLAGVKGTDQHPSEFDYGIYLGDHPSVFFPDDKSLSRAIYLSDSIPNNMGERLVLRDKNGNLVENPHPNGYDNGGIEKISFDRATFGTIATIELQVSPLRYAEFRDIPLRPNYANEMRSRLGSNVLGTAKGIAPGFTKMLHAGGSVSLEAVTKPIRDGKYWRFMGQPSWRGDGQVLADRPQINNFNMEVKVWGPNQLVRYQIRVDSAKDPSTVLVPAGALDSTFWLRDDRQYNDPHQTQSITEYEAKARSGSLKVGVASTPWKTIYNYPVNIPEMHKVTSQERPDSGQKPTGVEIKIASRPELTDYSTGKTIAMTDQPMDAKAMRLVAVLKNGLTKHLQIGAAGHGFVLCHIPARHGEFGEAYNQIIASDVKSIRLEARPYEWVNFDHIPLSPQIRE